MRCLLMAPLLNTVFSTEPLACDPSTLPKYPPTKEMDAKRRGDEARRTDIVSAMHGDKSANLSVVGKCLEKVLEESRFANKFVLPYKEVHEDSSNTFFGMGPYMDFPYRIL
ncbi:uncharacterized protein [Spinacia oleracea]|uniref:Uncharacterized protein isoform X1 n=1 Tax=Spinacia oleracea TaxID=3562 RepID=A0A9R0KCH9_SPIOL|nr:uncharacterized protein LOC110803776 isoform X1 [Spinacia oleracea]